RSVQSERQDSNPVHEPDCSRGAGRLCSEVESHNVRVCRRDWSTTFCRRAVVEVSAQQVFGEIVKALGHHRSVDVALAPQMSPSGEDVVSVCRKPFYNLTLDSDARLNRVWNLKTFAYASQEGRLLQPKLLRQGAPDDRVWKADQRQNLRR